MPYNEFVVFGVFRYILVASLTVVLFQNCQSSKFASGGSPSAPQNSGNGRTYDGKTYANHDVTCSDGDAAARILLKSDGSAELMKDNCEHIIPARLLTAAEYTVNANDTITFDNRSFTPETGVPALSSKGRIELPFGNYTSISLPLPSPLNSGDLVVCSVIQFGSANLQPVTAVTDSAGNTYQRGASPAVANNGKTMEIWYAQNSGAAAGPSVTAQFAATTNSVPTLSCLSYAGVAASNALAASVIQADDGSGGMTLNINAGAGDLVLAVFAGGQTLDAEPDYNVLLEDPNFGDSRLAEHHPLAAGNVNLNTFVEANGSIGSLLVFRHR